MSSALTTARMTDLIAYARRHRYRVRNLHDSGPVPPARRQKSNDTRVGYVGTSDRWDAIVGYAGYMADEGEPRRLGVYMHFRSAKGVKRAQARIQAIGGTVQQVGDTEIAGTFPVERIGLALKLIRVSKLKAGRPQNLNRPPYRTRTRPRNARRGEGALILLPEAV